MTKPKPWNPNLWKRPKTKNKNPYTDDNPSKSKHGNKSEKRVLDNLGAEQTIGSGAFAGMKSDGVLEHFRVECKATALDSMSLKYSTLDKIRTEALETNRLPLVTISFTDMMGEPKKAGDWIMMPSYLLEEFLEFIENGSE